MSSVAGGITTTATTTVSQFGSACVRGCVGVCVYVCMFVCVCACASMVFVATIGVALSTVWINIVIEQQLCYCWEATRWTRKKESNWREKQIMQFRFVHFIRKPSRLLETAVLSHCTHTPGIRNHSSCVLFVRFENCFRIWIFLISSLMNKY